MRIGDSGLGLVLRLVARARRRLPVERAGGGQGLYLPLLGTPHAARAPRSSIAASRLSALGSWLSVAWLAPVLVILLVMDSPGADPRTLSRPSTDVSSGARATRVDPTVLPVGSDAVRVRVEGANFSASSRVVVDGVPVRTDLLGPDRLQAELPAALLATAKRLELRVIGEQQERGDAPALVLTVVNPLPRLSVIEAPTLAVGEPAVPIRLQGQAFRPDTTVYVAGKAIETTFRSAEELTGIIPTALLTAAGTLPINVVTPGPGGGASLTGHLTVVNPVFPGRFLVFTSNRKQGRNHIYLLDRRGNRLDSLPEANNLAGTDAYPSISADGRFIAFQSDRQRRQYDVFLFDREKRTLDSLPEANHPTAFDGFPAISADGRFIVFESDRLGKPKIFLFDLQTRTLSELTHANEATADDGLAAISN